MPVSAVAVVVISFSVVLKLVVEEEVLQPEVDAPLLESIDEEEVSNMFDEQDLHLTAPEAVSGLSLPAERALKSAPPSAKEKLQRYELKKKRVLEQSKKQEAAAIPKASRPQSPAMQSFSAAIDMSAEESVAKPPEEQYIKNMLQLLEDKNYENLEREMLIFRMSYPDYELPEALKYWEQANMLKNTD